MLITSEMCHAFAPSVFHIHNIGIHFLALTFGGCLSIAGFTDSFQRTDFSKLLYYQKQFFLNYDVNYSIMSKHMCATKRACLCLSGKSIAAAAAASQVFAAEIQHVSHTLGAELSASQTFCPSMWDCRDQDVATKAISSNPTGSSEEV